MFLWLCGLFYCHFVYFMAIWNILWAFWYTFPRFVAPKKSGSPELHTRQEKSLVNGPFRAARYQSLPTLVCQVADRRHGPGQRHDLEGERRFAEDRLFVGLLLLRLVA
jgi:hypothetical protein